MIFVALAILAYLTAFNFRLADSVFYPPAVFTGLWATFMLLLMLSGDQFYPLSTGSLAVYVVGAACFSMGGVFGLGLPQGGGGRPLSPRHRMLIWNVLDIALVMMVLAFPFYLARLGQVITESRILHDPLVALRHELSHAEEGKLGMGVYRYLIVLFDFLALVAWSDCDGSRWRRMRCWIMATVVLAYHLCTASRVGAMLFVFALSSIVFFRRKKIALGPAVVGLIVFAAVFSGAAILLGKGGYRDGGLLENVTGVFHAFMQYLLGGLVAFNEVVSKPEIVEQNLFAFFYRIANAFGANIEVASCENLYVQTPGWTNVFTMYMAPYAQFGFLGISFYMFSLGAVCAWVYKVARRGSHWATVIYAKIAGTLMFTASVDLYLPSLSVWIQMAVFCWLVYQLPCYFLGAQPQCHRRQATAFTDRRVMLESS